jgi:type II secretory pathway component PulJ
MKKNIHRTERGFTAARDGVENPSVPRGFTLLLAVLVSSVLIALGSAIYSIVSKEIAHINSAA